MQTISIKLENENLHITRITNPYRHNKKKKFKNANYFYQIRK